MIEVFRYVLEDPYKFSKRKFNLQITRIVFRLCCDLLQMLQEVKGRELQPSWYLSVFKVVFIVTLFSRSSLWCVGLVIPILSISLQLNCLEGNMALQPSYLQIFAAGGLYWLQFWQIWNSVSFDIRNIKTNVDIAYCMTKKHVIWVTLKKTKNYNSKIHTWQGHHNR